MKGTANNVIAWLRREPAKFTMVLRLAMVCEAFRVCEHNLPIRACSGGAMNCSRSTRSSNSENSRRSSNAVSLPVEHFVDWAAKYRQHGGFDQENQEERRADAGEAPVDHAGNRQHRKGYGDEAQPGGSQPVRGFSPIEERGRMDTDVGMLTDDCEVTSRKSRRSFRSVTLACR